MKIYYLTDGAGWIVDRITNSIADRVRSAGHEVVIDTYNHTRDFTTRASESDIVHFMNWDISEHEHELDSLTGKLVVSVRSFRYPIDLPGKLAKHYVIVNNEKMLPLFPGSVYISDGVQPIGVDRRLRVGMVYYPTQQNEEYKGGTIVRAACERVGADFVLAVGVEPGKMVDWYNTVDVVVVASEAEGMGTILFECMALFKPCITTDCGHASKLGVRTVERSVDAIAAALEEYDTRKKVFPEYSVDNVAQQHLNYYNMVYEAQSR